MWSWEWVYLTNVFLTSRGIFSREILDSCDVTTTWIYVFFGQSSLKNILLGGWGWGIEVNYWCCWKTFWFLWKPLSIFQESFVPRESSTASPLWKEQLRSKTTLWKQPWPNNQCITIGLTQCQLCLLIGTWKYWASLVTQLVKNLPAVQETCVQSLGWEDPLEKGMATHSSVLAWRIHGQRSLLGYSPCGHKSWTWLSD